MRDYTQTPRKQERQARLKELSANKEVIQAHLADLRGRLPGLLEPGFQGLKQETVNKKRSAGGLPEGGLDAKRQRLDQERLRRVNTIWQQCQTILKGILKSKDAYVFSKPVNPVTAKCPDYFDIIKSPMDLGTIQKRLPKGRIGEKKSESKEYSSPYQFRDDMRLVWANCRNYNAVGHPVRNMGDALSEAWEKKWTLSGIEAKWDDEMQRQDLENKEVAEGNLAQQLHNLDSALQQRLNSTKPAVEENASEMTFERKRRLSIALGQLPGDKIAEVMRIIADDEGMREKATSAEEVEVDIDQLSVSTLGTLERYAHGVLHSTKKKPSGAKPQPAKKEAEAAPNGKEKPTPDNNARADERDSAASSSPSSSSDSETERSRSHSHSNVASQNEAAVPKNSRPEANFRGGNDAATLISTTRPPDQPQIVKNMAAKKVTNLQNEGAWAALGKEPAEKAAEDGDEEEGQPNGENDNLWDEFRSREQEEEQRKKEKDDEEMRQKEEKEKALQAAKLEAEQAKKEAEEKARREKDAENASIHAEREKAVDEIEKAAAVSEFAAGGVETMNARKQGETLNTVLGLQRRDSESDED